MKIKHIHPLWRFGFIHLLESCQKTDENIIMVVSGLTQGHSNKWDKGPGVEPLPLGHG